MKHLTLLTLSLCVALPSVWADNTITTVEQVSEAVTLSDDVDYHITSATPFTATNSPLRNSRVTFSSPSFVN